MEEGGHLWINLLHLSQAAGFRLDTLPGGNIRLAWYTPEFHTVTFDSSDLRRFSSPYVLLSALQRHFEIQVDLLEQVLRWNAPWTFPSINRHHRQSRYAAFNSQTSLPSPYPAQTYGFLGVTASFSFDPSPGIYRFLPTTYTILQGPSTSLRVDLHPRRLFQGIQYVSSPWLQEIQVSPWGTVDLPEFPSFPEYTLSLTNVPSLPFLTYQRISLPAQWEFFSGKLYLPPPSQDTSLNFPRWVAPHGWNPTQITLWGPYGQVKRHFIFSYIDAFHPPAKRVYYTASISQKVQRLSTAVGMGNIALETHLYQSDTLPLSLSSGGSLQWKGVFLRYRHTYPLSWKYAEFQAVVGNRGHVSAYWVDQIRRQRWWGVGSWSTPYYAFQAYWNHWKAQEEGAYTAGGWQVSFPWRSPARIWISPTLGSDFQGHLYTSFRIVLPHYQFFCQYRESAQCGILYSHAFLSAGMYGSFRSQTLFGVYRKDPVKTYVNFRRTDQSWHIGLSFQTGIGWTPETSPWIGGVQVPIVLKVYSPAQTIPSFYAWINGKRVRITKGRGRVILPYRPTRIHLILALPSGWTSPYEDTVLTLPRGGLPVFKIPLERTFSLRGKVVDPLRKVIGMQVLLVKDGQRVAHTYTDWDGEFFFLRVKPGTYQVVIPALEIQRRVEVADHVVLTLRVKR